jgi:hypothetical protein
MNSSETGLLWEADLVIRAPGNNFRRSSIKSKTSASGIGLRREMKSGAAGKSKSTADAIWSFRISPESGGDGIGRI